MMNFHFLVLFAVIIMSAKAHSFEQPKFPPKRELGQELKIFIDYQCCRKFKNLNWQKSDDQPYDRNTATRIKLSGVVEVLEAKNGSATALRLHVDAFDIMDDFDEFNTDIVFEELKQPTITLRLKNSRVTIDSNFIGEADALSLSEHLSDSLLSVFAGPKKLYLNDELGLGKKDRVRPIGIDDSFKNSLGRFVGCPLNEAGGEVRLIRIGELSGVNCQEYSSVIKAVNSNVKTETSGIPESSQMNVCETYRFLIPTDPTVNFFRARRARKAEVKSLITGGEFSGYETMLLIEENVQTFVSPTKQKSQGLINELGK